MSRPGYYSSRHLVSQPVRPSSPGMFSVTSVGTTSFSISTDSEYGDRALTPTLANQEGLSYKDLPPSYDEAQAEEGTTRDAPAYAYARSERGVESPDDLRIERLALVDDEDAIPAADLRGGAGEGADPSQTSSIKTKRLLSKALAWTQQLYPPEKLGPHTFLRRVIAIPQADPLAQYHSTDRIHFERAYSSSLLSYGIDAVIFAAFLQGVNTLSEFRDSETPVVALLDAYLLRVNDLLFRPRKLMVRMLDTEALLDVLLLGSVGRNARDAVMKVLRKGDASPREKAEALGPWTETLQWDTPIPDPASEVLSRAGPSEAHAVSADQAGTHPERFDSSASASASKSPGHDRELRAREEQHKYHDDSSSISSSSGSSTSTDTDSVYQEYLNRVKSIDDKTAKALSKGKQTPDEIARTRDKALKIAQQFLERRSERSARRLEWAEKKAMKRDQRKLRHEFWQQKHSMRGSDLNRWEKKAKKRELKMERREGKRALKEEWREAKWQRKQERIEETLNRRKEMIGRVMEAGHTWMVGRSGGAIGRGDDMQWLVVEALNGRP
ncbi:hypothetical protein K490DRAFT_62280 [Saccharata proteae CBS 121410]|uniref:Uncharacterized protein n=1 Tax=Saccharata proteae CBS 121410 TaxID=1314787 RepID=A0A9P4I1R8_9PEZI|nr:hypothetical protein K490DRAFT_62280 [Saccharata proteae CBS 121410]